MYIINVFLHTLNMFIAAVRIVDRRFRITVLLYSRPASYLCIVVVAAVYVSYDYSDVEMMEKFRPSLEEADVIQTRNLALDYIGKRGNATNVGRNERMAYAKNLLKVEVCVLCTSVMPSSSLMFATDAVACLYTHTCYTHTNIVYKSHGE
jgi:RNA polymerase Rpb2, domain 2